MTTTLSDRVQAFLKEKRFAVLSTINKDGSPHLTTMWYILEEDGTITMNTQVHLRKVKNMRRDPRIAICVEDGNRYVSINGTVELVDDQEVIRHDIERLVARYIDDEETRRQYVALFITQPRVALRLKCEKVTEYFV